MNSERWHLRHDSFASALALLEQACVRLAAAPGDDLIKAGTIQRFEMVWELGWKLLRDFLAAAGNAVAVPVPINVIRAAFESGLIADGDGWVASMKARNQMSHIYDAAVFEQVAGDVAARYLLLFRALDQVIRTERHGGN